MCRVQSSWIIIWQYHQSDVDCIIMKRITSSIDTDLHTQIKEMADKINWSFDFMVYTLLQQAVKERIRNIEKNRKKKSATEKSHS